MDDKEALALVMKRRHSRRIPKESNKKKTKKRVAAKKKPAKKKLDLKAYFAKLTPDQQKKFLSELLS